MSGPAPSSSGRPHPSPRAPWDRPAPRAGGPYGRLPSSSRSAAQPGSAYEDPSAWLDAGEDSEHQDYDDQDADDDENVVEAHARRIAWTRTRYAMLVVRQSRKQNRCPPGGRVPTAPQP